MKYLHDMSGKELMCEDTLHGHYLTTSSGWMVIVFGLVLTTSTTRMVWNDIQSDQANGFWSFFITKICIV